MARARGAAGAAAAGVQLTVSVSAAAGPGHQSPVARMQQAEIEIEQWLKGHLEDASGALHLVLHRQVKASELLLKGHDRPLNVLAEECDVSDGVALGEFQGRGLLD